MSDVVRTNRRDFLRAGAAGLVIGFVVPTALLAQPAPVRAALPQPNAFLHILPNGDIVVRLSHSEMGQGVWTALPMLIAEELEADWSKIKVEHAPAGAAYAHTAFGIQMTGGSTSTASEFERYRQVGAMARVMLMQAAAARFGVPVGRVRAENGFIIAGQQRASYGELAEAAARLTPPTSVTLKHPKDWKLIGQATKRLDTPEKISGRAQFGMDVHFEGLKTALVARVPVFGGKLKRFDGARAMRIDGVRAVVEVPSGVAVVADNYWLAKRGRDALEIEWDLGTNAELDTASLLSEYQRLAGDDGLPAVTQGDVANALGDAKATIEAEYLVPFLAHAPMEPLNCTVRIGDGECEIWTGTQFQTVDQGAAAKILGIAPEKVVIHTMFLGGGFGRRANPVSDFVSEAVHVAKAAKLPVKTVWSREDDIRGGYYRPMFLHRARIGLDADGMPMAWQHHIVGESIMAGTPFEPMMVKDGVDATSVEGIADSPYLKSIADRRVGLTSPKNGVPVLWWRSVGHSHTAFVMETLIDELAHAARRDPVEYRRKLLADHPRHLATLELAASKSGWGSPTPEGRARGIAVHESFGSFVAHVAEVSIIDRRIHVHRVVCAIDCGMVVNPEGVRAQMESSVAFGLGAALHSRVTFADGRVEQSNFHDYQVLRLHEMPHVDVHIVPSTESPGGAGEPGTPLIAPAVANAVFKLTGKRLRRMPFDLDAEATA